MKAIETKAKVDNTRTLTITMQVPADVQAGEYEAMVVLNSLVGSSLKLSEQKNGEPKTRAERWQKWFEEVDQLPLKADATESFESEQTDDLMLEAWDKWAEGVENLSLSSQPAQSEYQQHLVERYRAQGLEL